MNMIRKAILLSLAAGAIYVAGCSSEAPNSPTATRGGAASPEQTGTIAMDLQLGPSITLASVQYVITNPTLGGFTTITNTVDVTNSQVVGFSLTLPVGTGFTLALGATDSVGDACSAGPVTFQITAGQTSAVGLTLVCSRTVDSGVAGPDVSVGTLVVTADASLETTVVRGSCAAANSLVAEPNEVNVGGVVNLSATGIDPSFQSSDVTLTWAATGGAGSLTGTTGTTNTFECTVPGNETVTVTAAISNGGGSCPNIGSLSVAVKCDGSADASAPETGTTAEASAPETGTTAEASAPETGTTSALAPCTTAGQANCVKCEGNETGTGANGGLCTPTEASFVQKDITGGLATVAGDDPANGCYSCLFNAGCIDDTAFGDVNHECGDPLTAGTASECLATESCFISTSCAWGGSLASSAVGTCYCGTAPSSGSCNNSAPTGGANGACDTQIATGNGFAVDDGHNNLVNLTNPALASGKADQIFQCALSNSCDMCLH